MNRSAHVAYRSRSLIVGGFGGLVLVLLLGVARRVRESAPNCRVWEKSR